MKVGRIGIEKKGNVSLYDIMEYVKSNPETRKSGALVTFIGIVRGFTHEGKEVDKLELEAHEKEAEKALTKISDELRMKPGIVDVILHHLTGIFSVGEEMVYVVVTGASRKDVFPVLIEAVERYKHEAPIWKKEYLKDGTAHWISE
ncbi:MAG: hypothetical protein QG670_1518 [Thermoproteota archaeon]|nr:hypothetical protein [Thermoproteota archaeon]